MASTSTSSTGLMATWAGDPSPPVAYLSRKALPIKRHDAEPLTREDVQFDLLQHIFSDKNAVFTNPNPGGNPLPSKSSKVTFAELYVSALYNSSKCSKVLREKMLDTPAFSIELAKISLLTNVGRINTTMAFFPEMKTALRTYHPVPSLQKTDGNAQDAPRIKNCLKAALLPSEVKTAPPSSPDEILDRRKAGQRPPTTIVNLIFVLANHAAPLASVHFDGALNFLDLFLPHKGLVSADRARTFLWLAYHYLEDNDSEANPFDDDYSRRFPGKAPLLNQMSSQQMRTENVDTAEEIAWGKKMSSTRNAFLQKLVNSMEEDKKPKATTAIRQFIPVSANSLRRTRQSGPSQDASNDEGAFMYYVPQDHPNTSGDPNRAKRHPALQLQAHPNIQSQQRMGPPTPLTPRSEPPRTMLQQAWHSVNTTDPLADSDEEIEISDLDHVRLDYTRRIDVLAHIQRPSTTHGS